MSRNTGGKKPLTRLATLAALSPWRGPVMRFIRETEATRENTKIVGTNSKKSLKTKEDASYGVLKRTQNEPDFEHKVRESASSPRQSSGFLLPNWLMWPGCRRRQNCLGGQTCKAH